MNGRYYYCLYCFGCRGNGQCRGNCRSTGIIAGHEGHCGAGVAESALSDCQEPSSLEVGWDHRVTDGNLLGVVCPGARSEVLGMTCDRSSCTSAVMLVAASQGYFVVGCMEEGGIEDVGGTEAMGASSLSFTLERLTHRSNGLWVGLPRVSVS